MEIQQTTTMIHAYAAVGATATAAAIFVHFQSREDQSGSFINHETKTKFLKRGLDLFVCVFIGEIAECCKAGWNINLIYQLRVNFTKSNLMNMLWILDWRVTASKKLQQLGSFEKLNGRIFQYFVALTLMCVGWHNIPSAFYANDENPNDVRRNAPGHLIHREDALKWCLTHADFITDCSYLLNELNALLEPTRPPPPQQS